MTRPLFGNRSPAAFAHRIGVTATVEITAQTTADDVDGWDSLSHALFLMNIERAFALRFAPADVIDLENVGDLVRLVAAARAA